MPILTILLVSAVTLGLEILLTNIFSIALFSSHGAVAIALALLGVAAGGALGFLEGEVEPKRWARRLPLLLALLSMAVVTSIWGLLQIEFVPGEVSYWLYFRSTDFLSSGKLYYAIPIAFLPFLLSGYVQVGIFKNQASRFGVLYGADLIGATLGSVLFPLLLYPLGLKGVAVVMAAVLLAPVLLMFLRERRVPTIAGLVIAAGLVATLANNPSFRVKHCAGQSTWLGNEGRLVEEIWTPLARIALVERGAGMQSYVINNSFAAYAPNTEGHINLYSRELFRVPVQAQAGGDVLVIASGGGPGIIMARHFGANSIDAVEIADGVVNHIVHDRKDDPDNPYLLDRVDYHIADARSFVMRQDKLYDLILLRTIEGFSATGQLASAWSTNFITSQEAVREYVDHLSDDGVFAFSTAAYPGSPSESQGKEPLDHPVTQIRTRSLTAGLKLAGVENPEQHLVILQQANWFLYLVKKTPFTQQDLRRYFALTADLPRSANRAGELVVPEVVFPDVSAMQGLPEYLAPDPASAARVSSIMASTEPIGISALSTIMAPAADNPLSDDRPYKFKSGLLDFSGEGFEFILGDSYRKLVGIVSLLALVFVGLPFIVRRRGRGDEVSNLNATLLGIAILTGLGFMFIEMSSMYRFQLYLHHPTIAMMVVLSSMICGAGFGSMHSSRSVRSVAQVARYCKLSAAYGLLVFLAPLFLHEALLSLSLPLIIALLFLVFLGLGYLLGHVVPLSIAVFAGEQPRVVAWCWAITVTFSVFASILSAILTRSAGVSAVAALGILCYAAIPVLLKRRAKMPASPA